MKLKAPKTLVITRSRWRTGDYFVKFNPNNSSGSKATNLYHPETKEMCCLGFFSRQCGVPLPKIKNLTTPEDTDLQIPILTYGVNIIKNTSFTNTAMRINDADIPNEKREEMLTKHFAKKGIKVIFKGKYKKD